MGPSNFGTLGQTAMRDGAAGNVSQGSGSQKLVLVRAIVHAAAKLHACPVHPTPTLSNADNEKRCLLFTRYWSQIKVLYLRKRIPEGHWKLGSRLRNVTLTFSHLRCTCSLDCCTRTGETWSWSALKSKCDFEEKLSTPDKNNAKDWWFILFLMFFPFCHSEQSSQWCARGSWYRDVTFFSSVIGWGWCDSIVLNPIPCRETRSNCVGRPWETNFFHFAEQPFHRETDPETWKVEKLEHTKWDYCLWYINTVCAYIWMLMHEGNTYLLICKIMQVTYI